MPKFDTRVRLVGTDGNAFSIMGNVVKGLRKAGATTEQIDEYRRDSMSGDYNHLLTVAHEWVEVY